MITTAKIPLTYDHLLFVRDGYQVLVGVVTLVRESVGLFFFPQRPGTAVVMRLIDGDSLPTLTQLLNQNFDRKRLRAIDECT